MSVSPSLCQQLSAVVCAVGNRAVRRVQRIHRDQAHNARIRLMHAWYDSAENGIPPLEQASIPDPCAIMTDSQLTHHGLWGDRLRLNARGLDYPGHQHAEIEINWLPPPVPTPTRAQTDDPLATLVHGGRHYHLKAGDGVLFWAGLPHGYLAGATFEVAWITLPLNDIRPWQLSHDFMAALLGGDVVPLEPARLHMTDWIAQLRSSDTHAAADVRSDQRIALHELAALMLRVQHQTQRHRAGSATAAELNAGQKAGRRKSSATRQRHQRQRKSSATRSQKTKTAGSAGSERARRAMAWLRAHFRDQVDIAVVAEACGCHPSTLMVDFKRRHGCTLMHYCTQLRLAEAARLLVATQRPVLDIALSVGFQSQSRFYAAFSRNIWTAADGVSTRARPHMKCLIQEAIK